MKNLSVKLLVVSFLFCCNKVFLDSAKVPVFYLFSVH